VQEQLDGAVPLVVVGFSPADALAPLAGHLGLTGLVLSDPDRRLYHRLGLRRAPIWRVYSPGTIARYARRKLRGATLHRPVEDTARWAGTPCSSAGRGAALAARDPPTTARRPPASPRPARQRRRSGRRDRRDRRTGSWWLHRLGENRRVAEVGGCPCGSGERYDACCGPAHAGSPVPTAAALMRSRYSAFVLGLDAYCSRAGTRRPDPPTSTSTTA
jgi:hypothetical protein